MKSSAEVTLLLTMVVVTECQTPLSKLMYANIRAETVELYKAYCLVCQEKRKRPRTTGVVVKPILSNKFNSRGHQHVFNVCIALSAETWHCGCLGCHEPL